MTPRPLWHLLVVIMAGTVWLGLPRLARLSGDASALAQLNWPGDGSLAGPALVVGNMGWHNFDFTGWSPYYNAVAFWGNFSY